MQRLYALIIITRPLNVAITGVSILVAALLVRPFHFTLPVLYAVISAMLIAAGANVINDFFDLDIDRINRPQRILPAGRLAPKTALTFTIFLLACGNFFSILINKSVALIAIITSLLLVVYSWKLKRQPLSGNVAVSLATALAFIYGALAAQAGLAPLALPSNFDTWKSGWRAGMFPALFSFLMHFGREVIKDIEDQAGDAAMQARTLPLVHGLRTAQSAATVAFGLLLVVTVVPFQLGIYSATYFWIILLGVDPVLLLAVYGLWKNPVRQRMRQLSAMLKADMLVGLAAIYCGT
ncbi:MAG: Protoheme IX farnesyltransferase [bacterium]|nr:Protoheme IX farnesyltransferase [bacterium]